MKIKGFILFLILSFSKLYSQLPNRGCGTAIPSSQYDSLFQQKVIDYLNTTTAASRVQSTFQIPVIFHVIHGGQAIGTYPNINQGQLNSQIQVLNDDYGGTGFNTGNYPATAFLNYAMNTQVLPGSKDAFGNIAIANTGISFCLALKDSIGNVLSEPGIERKNWSSIAGATNPALASTAANLTTLMDNIIKPATIWSPNKYLNIWVTDVGTGAGLLGYATFPPLSGLVGVSGGGTATTDGLWCWAKTCGSQNIFPTGTYSAPYNYGRTLTHEISHYLGLRHTWGDVTCGNDFCNDTPPEQSASYGVPTYPYLPNACPTYTPPTGPEGVMFMNFADYTDDAAMYMFTEDQKIRMQTAMTNSPYRNQLGTHGYCNATATIQANFSLSATVINQGQSVNITDLSTASNAITSWNYVCVASTPSLSTLQNPTLTFNTAGIHTISLTVTAAGLNSSTTKTIQVNACPIPTVNVNSINPTCAGACNGSATLVAVAGSGAPYTYSWTPAVSSSSVASGLCAGVYSCVVTNSCATSVTKIITINPPPAISLTIGASNPTVCAGNSTTITAIANGGTPTYSFNWNTGSTANNIIVNPTIIPVTGYTVTVSDLQGCVKTASIGVTVNSIPSITVSPNNPTICAGKTATINLSGAASFTTIPGNINSSTFTVNPLATTIYTITGSSPFGCIGIRKDTITVVNTPTISSSVNSNTVCFGSSITFSNSGGASYTLSPSSFTGNTINITPTVMGTTIFTVTGAGPFGCINTKTISVTTFSLPLVSITPSLTTICAGQIASLNVSGANTYTWTTGSSLNVISVTPTVSTPYSVIGANSFGCQNSANATINVLNTPIVTINTPSTSVCFGYTMTVVANGASNYNWSTGATTNTTIIQPFSNVTYSVVGTNGGSCSDTAFLSLTVLPLPSVSASVSNTLACVGQSITLNASGSLGNNYLWQPNNLIGVSHTVQIFTPTTYTVYGQGSNGCAFFSTAFVDVQNGNAVIPVVTPSAVCVGDTAILSIIGGTIPLWSANSIPNTSFVTPAAPTSYTFSATDFAGCVSNVVFNVDINSNCDVIVYNGFTPNGDGVNDFFIIDNIDKYPNNNVQIFNRWGNRVFITSRYDNATNNWDGKLNGKPVTSGTYFYLILNDNGKVLKKGWIELTN
jgi:gliding motility-associated-like protein